MMMNIFNDYSVLILELINARMSKNEEQINDKLFHAITGILKHHLIQTKPVELTEVISVLIHFYKEKEEYEKCHLLNQTGFEIFNTIN